MSEAAAAAPATEAAPAESTAPVTEGTKATEKEAAPADPYAEYNALLKAKPLKYKAKGKEYVVDDVSGLLRKASQAHAQDEVFAESTKLRDEARTRTAKLDAYQSAKTLDEKLELAREMLGEDFGTIAEELVYRDYQKQKEAEGLSPREAQLKKERDELAAERDRLAKADQERNAKAEDEKLNAEVTQLRERFAGTAMKALKTLNVDAKRAPALVARMVPLLARAEQLGLDVDEVKMAEDVRGEMLDEVVAATSHLEGEALLQAFGEKVAARIGQAFLARQQGGAAPAPAKREAAAKPQTQDVGKKRELANEFWRSLKG